MHVRLLNPDNTHLLSLSTTISILENEVSVHNLQVPADTMRAVFLDPRIRTGAIIVYMPKSLYAILLEDTYLFYEDDSTSAEILLKVEQCSSNGHPLTPDAEEVSTERSRAANMAAARERRDKEKQLRTVKIRYDLPCTCLSATVANGRLKPIIDGLTSQAQAIHRQARITAAQPRDEFHRVRNSLDIYIEFPSQLDQRRASYSGVKFFAPGRGMAPLGGYIMPQKLASLSLQQCCFRSPEACGKDRSEGFATCRQRARFAKAVGHDDRSTEFQDRKRKAVDEKLEAQRKQTAAQYEKARARLCGPYLAGQVRSATNVPLAHTHSSPYALTVHHHGMPQSTQGPILHAHAALHVRGGRRVPSRAVPLPSRARPLGGAADFHLLLQSILHFKQRNQRHGHREQPPQPRDDK